MFLEWENNSGKLQIISGKFQNNAINDVKQISLSYVIMKWSNHIVSLIGSIERTIRLFWFERSAQKLSVPPIKCSSC